MKFKAFWLTMLLLLLASPIALADDFVVHDNPIDNNMKAEAHVAYEGWLAGKPATEPIGTTGHAHALEAFKLSTNVPGYSFSYAAHVKNIGWQNNVSDGQEAGTTGKALPIEAIKITLNTSPEVADTYDVYYRSHIANFGWLNWAKNGEESGSTGLNNPLEAIQVVVYPKGALAPGLTNNACLHPDDFVLSLQSHVSNDGWLSPVSLTGIGETRTLTVGTTGNGKKFEAIEAKVTDPYGKSGVITRTYVENHGWLGTSNVNGSTGTIGSHLSIEALQFELTGPAKYILDINYHTHAQNFGWLPWTANNGISGTKDGALRTEAVEVRLMPKNRAIVQNNAYIIIPNAIGVIPPAPTCIVLNIDSQRMALYENYQVTQNTNVVTGYAGIDDTHRGDFTVLEKLSPYRTVGPGYDAIVDYWLTLYLGDIYGFDGEGHIVDRVGIHDADWRTMWGPEAYLVNGSHGCVNTPYGVMDYIFHHVEVGTPVRIK